MVRRPPEWFIQSILIGVGSLLLVVLLQGVGVVRDLTTAFEDRTLDYRTAWYRGLRQPDGTAPAEPVIVAIDERSLSELGRFPTWPRSYHAAVVDRLNAAGARAIGFDLLFPEADRPAEDNALVRAIRHSGRVVLGTFRGDDGTGDLTGLVPEFAAAARAVGHVHVDPDPDGIVRRVRLLVDANGSRRPALGAAVARVAGAIDMDTIATAAGGDFLLDYVGPPGTFLRVPYADVLAGRVDPNLFRGRAVLVGATAAGLMDVVATPFPGAMPGVEVHATLAYDLLTGRALHRAGAPVGLLTGLLLAVLAAMAFGMLRPPIAALVALGGLVVFILAAFETLAGADVWVPVVQPVMAWTVAGLAASGRRYGTEARDRLAIKRAFSRYLAADVVEEISRNPDQLALGGEERVVTVGFIDLRDFTGLSERLEPIRLTALLSAFFSTVTGAIQAHGGMVDKYIGDAVMVVFGAPQSQPDHAERACHAALAVARAVDSEGERWAELGAPDLRIGIALNTGPAVVGNVGAATRFDYTALGDAVNVAARLEGLNGRLGTRILVGGGTREAVGGALPFRDRGSVEVKGKRDPVPVFELLEPEPEDVT